MRRRQYLTALLLLLAMLLLGTAQAEGFKSMGNQATMNTPAAWGELNTHDPAIVRDGDWYYVFSTDASLGDVHKRGIQIRKSADLISWEYVGTAFADYAVDCAAEIAHAKLDVAAGNGLWAPDVVKVGDTWRMYYSASTFGSSRSALGLAESDNIEGPYTDRGIVLKSDTGAVKGPNCIDPAIITDDKGQQWMSYGSFSGGIFIVPLGEDGFVQPDAKPIKLAGNRGAAVEGSAIVYLPENGWYYLFVSYGSLSSDYNIRVGRSREVTGPYLDAAGNDLCLLATGNETQIGTKLMGGFLWQWPDGAKTLGTKAPGHCSVLVQDGGMFLVHHARTQTLPDYWFRMEIREMPLNAEGWPVVLPMRYQGETAETLSDLPDGGYQLIAHQTDSNAEPHDSVAVTLKDGVLTGAYSGTYTLTAPNKVSMTLDGASYDGVAVWQTDDERGGQVMSLSLMSADGQCIWLCSDDLYHDPN